MIAKLGAALVLTLMSAAPLAAEPFHHPYGEWREYERDWLAVCPDSINEDAPSYYGYSCFASTNSQELNSANLPAYQITMMRNRLNGELDVAVTIAADGVEPDTSRPMLFEFTGDVLLRLDFDRDLETRHNTVNQFFVANPEDRDALLELMKQRSALTLIVPLRAVDGTTRSQPVRLSLRGVLASLDFMATYARKVAQY